MTVSRQTPVLNWKRGEQSSSNDEVSEVLDKMGHYHGNILKAIYNGDNLTQIHRAGFGQNKKIYLAFGLSLSKTRNGPGRRGRQVVRGLHLAQSAIRIG